MTRRRTKAKKVDGLHVQVELEGVTDINTTNHMSCTVMKQCRKGIAGAGLLGAPLVGMAICSPTFAQADPLAHSIPFRFMDIFGTDLPLLVRILSLLTLAVLVFSTLVGLYYLSKILLGLIRRRRVCMIPVQVTTQGASISGFITVLGRNCSRFVPDGMARCEALQALVDAPEMHFFTLEAGDLKLPVFIDGMNGHFTPCAFDQWLTLKEHEALLKQSTIPPRIGQLIAVPHDIMRHRVYIQARAEAGQVEPPAPA
ncbi:hypothetical protein [Cognatishimia maritima]|uniref:Uncharacterized protein n=1 Tax=Cognatishimia maritima TaxID=870908 RepID=A0A1M5TSB0_9RHOB|nr:hypothetical protein [Cognatishimia maritima]SHH53579.1 hypothetical protein SAMN04488044_2683 [Cognatishimia maritima]